jgi:hypothetical protein
MLLLQADCDTRKCCWVGDDVNVGSCYHRLPSPYSLSLSTASQVGYKVQTSVPDPDPNPDPDPDPHFLGLPDPGSDPFSQRCRSGSFYHPSIIKQNSKKILDSYCFVTSFGLFIFEKLCKCTFKK